MAQRDYVKDNTNPKKTKQNKKEKSKKKFPLKWIFLLILFLMIAFAIYLLTKNGATKKAITAKTQNEVATTPLPEKPESRFTYVKTLENPDANRTQNVSNTDSKKVETTIDQLASKKETTAPANTESTNTAQAEPAVTSETQNQPISIENSDAWQLQCGAFRAYANAENLRAKLLFLGVKAFIKREDLNRVMVGPYDSREKADADNLILKENGITNCIALKN